MEWMLTKVLCQSEVKMHLTMKESMLTTELVQHNKWMEAKESLMTLALDLLRNFQTNGL